MSVTEQAGKAIDAMKGSPGLLALILLQLVTLGLLAYVNNEQSDRRQQREMLLLERCLDGEKR